jgi:glycosyltransferase involved in cell wall biosynthesis
LKKNILFVNGHLNVGGVENSLINVLKSIDYNSYEVDLILFEEMGDYADEVPKEVNIIYYDLSKAYGPFYKCILINMYQRNWFSLYLRLIFLLEKVFGGKVLSLAKPLFKLNGTYDCAIAYRVGIATDFVSYIVNSKKKLTWWHHGSFDYPPKLVERWSEVYKNFDKLIAVSDSCKDMLIKNLPGISNKILTIPNIINVEEIRYKANDNISHDMNSNEYITLLSLGRLSPEKGMINCVYACKKLVENGYNIKWYLIGEGTQRAEIESCIKQYKLEGHIFLLGAMSNPYPYIKKAHIYVHPSLVESLSITVLEALALNTPVTVAKSLGPTEFIRDKENGLLVEPTPDGLFKGIESLIKNEDLYRQLKNDKSGILKKFSPEIISKKIHALIDAS